MKTPLWILAVLLTLIAICVLVLVGGAPDPKPKRPPVEVKPGVAYFTNLVNPPPGVPLPVYAMLEFPVVSNKTYTVQLTTDFVEYRTIGSFTASNGQTKAVWTVNPAAGPWPRLLEQ